MRPKHPCVLRVRRSCRASFAVILAAALALAVHVLPGGIEAAGVLVKNGAGDLLVSFTGLVEFTVTILL